MKRNIKFYTVAEEGYFELADIIKVDLKRNGIVRNIHNLKVNNEIKKMLSLEEDDDDLIQDILLELINGYSFLLKKGDLSIFKNTRYNNHIEEKETYNKYKWNPIATFDSEANSVIHYIAKCMYDVKEVLFNPDINDCYKLQNIDCLIFLLEKNVKEVLPFDIREKCCNDIRLINALNEVYPNLTEGEYSLIKKRFCVLADIFYLYDSKIESKYKKEIEECVIFDEDDTIERFIKLTPFHNLIKTR